MDEYIQPNMSNEDAVSLIKEKIKTNTPFAFTRYGDGEVYIMTNRSKRESWLQKSCKDYGYDYKKDGEIEQFYKDYNKILWGTFTKSDMVGIMKSECSILPGKQNLDDWSFKKELLKEKNIDIENLLITEHQLSRHKIMGSVEGMRDIIQGNDIHIITITPNNMIERNLDKLLGINITYTENKMSYSYRNRDEILKQFKNIKENIVLYGSGIDKDYGTILRDKYGKIALDMGSVMEAWSGRLARNTFKEGQLQSYLLIK